MKGGAKVQGGTKVRAGKGPKKPQKKSRRGTAAANTTRKKPHAEPQTATHLSVAEKPAQRRAKLVTAPWLRYLFITVGFISLLLGIIGVVTPVLPTTPFILLSGYCFARGSERFHDWILAHRYFGPMIRAFRDEKRIPLKAKIFATAMIVLTMSITAIFFVKKIYAIIAMATVGVVVVIYLWTFKN